MARFDITDAEWALIEPLLPVAATGPLPRRVRDQFNGVLWRFRTGGGWRDVPERYGPWSTVYSRFNAWAKAGVFQSLMDALIAEAASRGLVGLELVSVDSTVVRAHQESAGLAIAGETLDALEQALTEEKGAPLPKQPPVWRVIRRRSHPVRTVPVRRRVRIVPQHGADARPGRKPPGSAGREAD
ncbi:hypothetical protein GCM10009838_89130 [Catenulispora subtropica]|uniref:Insertion element IS402-like domain-containing protein n=1 Tax=Catenulispora subtropica TaxID=450798 RepID=A0ABN2THP0_9ACTN